MQSLLGGFWIRRPGKAPQAGWFKRTILTAPQAGSPRSRYWSVGVSQCLSSLCPPSHSPLCVLIPASLCVRLSSSHWDASCIEPSHPNSLILTHFISECSPIRRSWGLELQHVNGVWWGHSPAHGMLTLGTRIAGWHADLPRPQAQRSVGMIWQVEQDHGGFDASPSEMWGLEPLPKADLGLVALTNGRWQRGAVSGSS